MPKAADDPTFIAKTSFIAPSRGDGFATHDDNFPAQSVASLLKCGSERRTAWSWLTGRSQTSGLLSHDKYRPFAHPIRATHSMQVDVE